jgi:hypothetical protein
MAGKPLIPIKSKESGEIVAFAHPHIIGYTMNMVLIPLKSKKYSSFNP